MSTSHLAKRPLRRSLLTASVVLMAVACGPGGQNPSRLNHAPHMPVNSPRGWNWELETEAEFMARQTHQRDPAKASADYLAADHPMRQRLNMWVGQIYDAQVAAHPDLMRAVPRPTVLVQKSNTLNAFVDGKTVCLSNVALALGGDGPVLKRVLLDEGDLLDMEGIATCEATRTATRDEIAERIANNVLPHDCPVALEDGATAADGTPQFILRPAATCSLGADLDGAAGAAVVAVTVTVPYVQVFSALVEKFSELEVVAILAHELGHYFRAHMATRWRYDFAYRLTFVRDPLSPHEDFAKPFALDDPELVAVTGAARGLSRDASRLSALEARINDKSLRLGTFAPVPGQRHPSSVAPLVQGLANLSWRATCAPELPAARCNWTCQAADRAGEEFSNPMSFALPLLPEQRDRYLAYEALADQCLGAVAVAARGDALAREQGSLNLYNLAMVLAFSGLKQYFPFDHEPKTALEFLQLVESGVRADNQPYDPARVVQLIKLKDRVKGVTDQAAAMHKATTDLEQMLNRERIGLYSTEQEADELSLEFLAMIGLDPRLAIKLDVDLTRLRGDREITSGLSCSGLQAAGWMVAGKPFIVPIGTMEVHHQSCSRAFNIEREIIAHGYPEVSGPDQRPLASGDWSALVAPLAQGVPERFDDAAAAALLSNRPSLPCAFSILGAASRTRSGLGTTQDPARKK